MLFNWPGKQRKSITRNALRKLLFRELAGYAKPPLDRSYQLFINKRDFLQVCPRPKKWATDYDCNRQVAEIMGKLQKYAIGGIIVEWKNKKIRHALLFVAFEDNTAKLFDVNNRTFHDPKNRKVINLWM